MTDYHFVFTEEGAHGKLPDGTPFIIDPDLVNEFSKKCWNTDKDGYIRSSVRGSSPLMLHRWVADASSCFLVDHINRNRKDCRRCNLRVVSPQQNAMNHSLFTTNKTGYTGVFFDKTKKKYVAKVGYNGKRIYLGSSKNDIVKLAQMYNIAASYLFGEFAGVLNDVDTAPPSLQNTIISKCNKHIAA